MSTYRNPILQNDYACSFMWVQLCSTLCDLMDCSPPGSSVCGFSRQEYWSELPFPTPWALPDSGIKPTSPALAGRFFTTQTTGKTLRMTISTSKLYCPIYLQVEKWKPGSIFSFQRNLHTVSHGGCTNSHSHNSVQSFPSLHILQYIYMYIYIYIYIHTHTYFVYDPVILLLGIYPKKAKTLIRKRYIHPNVHSDKIYNCQDTKAI